MRFHIEALVAVERVWGVFGVLTAASLAILAAGVDGEPVQQPVHDSPLRRRQPRPRARLLPVSACRSRGR